jgi:hypothetical protein
MNCSPNGIAERRPASKVLGANKFQTVYLYAERRSAHLTRAFYDGLLIRMRIAVGRFSPSLVMPAF